MVVPLFAIAAGASLISGFLQKSSAKKQAAKEEKAIRDANDKASAAAEQMNKQIRARADAAALVPVQTEREHFGATATAGGVDMDAFLAAAERGGFNPLTFLRSGALSLFSQTQSEEYTDDWTCTTGERAMDAALSGTYLPQLSPVISQTKVPGTGDVLGNALTSGANQYLSDLSQQQNNQFQMDLLRSKLAGAGASGAYSGPRSGYVPQAFLSGGGSTRGGAGLTYNQALQPSADPGWIRMPNGAPHAVSAIDEPKTTWDDVKASVNQFQREAQKILAGPWSSWLVKAPAFFTGEDVIYLPQRPAAPAGPSGLEIYRTKTAPAIDSWLNKYLMGH